LRLPIDPGPRSGESVERAPPGEGFAGLRGDGPPPSPPMAIDPYREAQWWRMLLGKVATDRSPRGVGSVALAYSVLGRCVSGSGFTRHRPRTGRPRCRPGRRRGSGDDRRREPDSGRGRGGRASAQSTSRLPSEGESRHAGFTHQGGKWNRKAAQNAGGPGAMRFFHHTTEEAAENIVKHGFRDAPWHEEPKLSGVWISDILGRQRPQPIDLEVHLCDGASMRTT
jgi:hypothetical protein